MSNFFNIFMVFVGKTSQVCMPTEFRCRSGHCIFKSFRCNNRVDCPYDDSDELYCDGKSEHILIRLLPRALYRIAIYRLYRYFSYMIHIVSFILVTRYFKRYIFT